MAARQMQATTIRFGATLHAALEEAADQEGISFSQYVREAAVMRICWEQAVSGERIRELLALTRNEES